MRRSNASAATEDPDRELKLHIRALGLPGVEEYRRWCTENGFSRKLNKHWKVRSREQSFAGRRVSEARLARKKQEERSFPDVLRAICERQLQDKDVTQPGLKYLCQAIQSFKNRKHEQPVKLAALQELLLAVGAERDFFDSQPVVRQLGQGPDNTFLGALIAVALHRRYWLRPVETWKCRTHNPRRRFASLLRHLFARYEVPAFMDCVWFAGRTPEAIAQQDWYLHLGLGRNLRHCALPLTYTKKMAHAFLQAPDDLSVPQALRWGQVIGLGGDHRLARAISGTRLTETFANEPFWETVIVWLIDQPMFDPAQIGPLLDFLHHQRFEPQYVFAAPGCREMLPPPQPRLTMKGRSPESLLRQIRAWHRQLGKENAPQASQWLKSGIAEFEFVEGTAKSENLKCWTIREVLNGKALIMEGRNMRHCVASYAASCMRGTSSIWTMEVESFEGVTKLLTLETRNNIRQICQARGKTNRLPTEKERSILRRWAAAAGLTLAKHI